MIRPTVAPAARVCTIVLATLFVLTPAVAAQARPDLLRLLPDDFGLCLVVNDLRDHSERWQKSAWYTALRQSALGRTLLAAPELRDLPRVREDVRKNFGVDWPELRDEIFGDSVILAHRPAAADRPEGEQGVFLLWARSPALLSRLVARLNEIEQKSGEVTALAEITHKGATYVHRTCRAKEQWYYLDGSLLAVAGKEDTIRSVIARHRGELAGGGWQKKYRRAGADRAFLSLCVNPRVLEPDFVKKKKGAEAARAWWQALDAIFVTIRSGEEIELGLTVQARPEALPSWLRRSFMETAFSSVLWRHFPEQAVFALAGRGDFAETLQLLMDVTPEEKRKHAADTLQRNLGAVTGLDVFKDLLPNVGPDWGLCVLAAGDSKNFPQALAAVAVQPGPAGIKADQALYKALHLLSGLAILGYNSGHADMIRAQTTMQGPVEVRCLTNDKGFPAGFQPCYALKAGFLLIGSSPEAIQAFRGEPAPGTMHGLRPEDPATAGQESLVARLAMRGLAGILRHRREAIVASLVEKKKLTRLRAEEDLTNLVDFLGLFDRVDLTQRGEAGQANWLLRVYPAPPPRRSD